MLLRTTFSGDSQLVRRFICWGHAWGLSALAQLLHSRSGLSAPAPPRPAAHCTMLGFPRRAAGELVHVAVPAALHRVCGVLDVSLLQGHEALPRPHHHANHPGESRLGKQCGVRCPMCRGVMPCWGALVTREATGFTRPHRLPACPADCVDPVLHDFGIHLLPGAANDATAMPCRLCCLNLPLPCTGFCSYPHT